jgi:hypothetical protein
MAGPVGPCPVQLPPVSEPAAVPLLRRPDGKFARGNRGKIRGTKHRATRLLETLFQDNAEFVGEMALKMLAHGEPVALRELLNRLVPPPRCRVVDLTDFPRITSVADVPHALADLTRRVASGEISPEEAQAIAAVLSRYVESVSALEQAQKI